MKSINKIENDNAYLKKIKSLITNNNVKDLNRFIISNNINLNKINNDNMIVYYSQLQIIFQKKLLKNWLKIIKL